MTTKILLKVDGENAVTFTFPSEVEDVDFVQQIIAAASQNPTIVKITDLNNFPVVGMQFEDNNFIATDTLEYIDGSSFSALTSFAYIVDGIVMAIHKVPTDHVPWIAALMSNPTLEVSHV
jgi:hypothetical protein